MLAGNHGDREHWDVSAFKEGFAMSVLSLEDNLLELEVRGIDPPLANALRRILIAEVPTVAISEVELTQNTSVIPDENLVHRLGLVPICVDPDYLQVRTRRFDEETLEYIPQESLSDSNYSVEFRLHVVNPKSGRRINVYSKDLVWQPRNKEEKTFYVGAPPRPVANDIMIAKLAPGQEIDCVCWAERGVGKSHAKWMPVCNATYRMVQRIHMSKPVEGEDALRLQSSCPAGVIGVKQTAAGVPKAFVEDALKFRVHRECLEPFADLGVTVESVTNHYIFTIESVGSLPVLRLLEQAIHILRSKCENVKDMVRNPSSGKPDKEKRRKPKNKKQETTQD